MEQASGMDQRGARLVNRWMDGFIGRHGISTACKSDRIPSRRDKTGSAAAADAIGMLAGDALMNVSPLTMGWSVGCCGRNKKAPAR